MSATPTARTLDELRERGYVADVVERTMRAPGCKSWRKDFIGCVDVIAFREEGLLTYAPGTRFEKAEIVKPAILAIQTCAGTDHAKRVAKVLAEPRALAWVRAGGRLAVWSWAKRGAQGKRKLWTLREQELTEQDFIAQFNAAVMPRMVEQH